jgi:hypothetical protein
MPYTKSINKQARLAGLLYLLASIPASFCLIYVPNKLIVLSDATATADRVQLPSRFSDSGAIAGHFN